MALIKDGYWPDTYWASRYWQEDYWPEYGTGAAAAAPSAPGGRWQEPLTVRRRRPLPLDRAVLEAMVEYLIIKQES